MARLLVLVRSICFTILPPLLPLINSTGDYQKHQKANQMHFAMCLMFIQGFALHRFDVVVALIIACLAFEGRTLQNLILVNQPNSAYDLDLESLQDFITGAVMCIFALLLLLPSLIANRYG